MNRDSPQLTFPLIWQGKIIAEADPNVFQDVQRAVEDLGLEETVRRGNLSRTGRYVTLNITVEFQDRGMMLHVTETLAAVPGVRLVL